MLTIFDLENFVNISTAEYRPAYMRPSGLYSLFLVFLMNVAEGVKGI